MPRIRTCAALALASLVLLTGCGAAPPPATGAAPTGPATGAAPTGPAGGPSLPSLSAADAGICGTVRTTVNDATAAYTAQVQRWVAAADDNARSAALDGTRKAFREWAAALRAEAAKAGDPRLATTLTEYAGAVDAVIAAVKTADDLERLETLDGSEIDVAASRLARVCP